MPEAASSTRTLVLGTVAVIVLVVVATAVSAVPLGGLGTVIYVILALVAAFLILRFLMRLSVAPGMVALIAGSALLFSAIFFLGVLVDYLTRGWIGVPGR